jgi:hypothetical protein
MSKYTNGMKKITNSICHRCAMGKFINDGDCLVCSNCGYYVFGVDEI